MIYQSDFKDDISGWGKYDPTAVLADAFTARDEVLWAYWGSSNVVVNGDGFLYLVGSLPANYYGLETVNTYNFTGKFASMQLVDLGDDSLASWEVYPIQVLIDPSNRLEIGISGGDILSRKVIANVGTTLHTDAYDPDIHKYFRIREASGTTYFEYSTLGSIWVALHSVANPLAVTSVKLGMVAGTYSVEADYTQAKLDNFNTNIADNLSILSHDPTVGRTAVGSMKFQFFNHAFSGCYRSLGTIPAHQSLMYRVRILTDSAGNGKHVHLILKEESTGYMQEGHSLELSNAGWTEAWVQLRNFQSQEMTIHVIGESDFINANIWIDDVEVFEVEDGLMYDFDPVLDIGAVGQFGASVLSYEPTIGYQHAGSVKFQTFNEEWAGAYFPLGKLEVETVIRIKAWVRGGQGGDNKFVTLQILEDDTDNVYTSVPIKLTNENEWHEVWLDWGVTQEQTCSVAIAGFNYSDATFYIGRITVEVFDKPGYTVRGRKMYENGQPMKIRGMNYLNDAIGYGENNSHTTDWKMCFYDAQDLRDMGVDTVRLYTGGTNYVAYAASIVRQWAVLSAFAQFGIRVMISVWIDHNTDYSVATGGANRTAMIARLTEAVTTFGYHPAVMGFIFGNENNYNLGNTTTLNDLYTMLQAGFVAAKAINNRVLYTHAHGEVSGTEAFDSVVPAIDIVGLNIYRGRTLGGVGNLAADIIEATDKPAMLTEYGFDRWDATLNNGAGAEDEHGQAIRDVQAAKVAEEMWPTLSGHFIFAWADQYWKLYSVTWEDHSTAGLNAPFNEDRDGKAQEAWFGICAAEFPEHADFRHKKEAYYLLKEKYTAFPYGRWTFSPSIQHSWTTIAKEL